MVLTGISTLCKSKLPIQSWLKPGWHSGVLETYGAEKVGHGYTILTRFTTLASTSGGTTDATTASTKHSSSPPNKPSYDFCFRYFSSFIVSLFYIRSTRLQLRRIIRKPQNFPPQSDCCEPGDILVLRMLITLSTTTLYKSPPAAASSVAIIRTIFRTCKFEHRCLVEKNNDKTVLDGRPRPSMVNWVHTLWSPQSTGYLLLCPDLFASLASFLHKVNTESLVYESTGYQ